MKQQVLQNLITSAFNSKRFVIDANGKAGRKPSVLANAMKSKLAAAMIQPLRTTRDYTSIGRKCFIVEQLPPGALPYYEKDIDVASIATHEEKFKHNGFAISANGKGVKRLFGARVIFPKFEIYSNPTIRISDVKRRRFSLIDRKLSGFRNNKFSINPDGKATKGRRRRPFDVIDRAVWKARQEIMAREDANIFAALDALGSGNNQE